VFVVVPLRLEKRSEWSLERWYLDRSALNCRLLISIFFLYDLGVGTISDVTEEERESTKEKKGNKREMLSLRELFHDPRFATGRIMFTTINRFFTPANFPLTLSNLEFAFEDILGPSTGVIHPAGNSKVCFLHDLLDDSGSGRHLGNGGGNADRARRRLDDTAGSTDEDFSLTAGDLSLTLSNIAFALSEGLGPFGSNISPYAFIYSRLGIGNGVSWCGRSSRSVLGGQ